jgi:hypothetical protein
VAYENGLNIRVIEGIVEGIGMPGETEYVANLPLAKTFDDHIPAALINQNRDTEKIPRLCR